MNDRQPNANLAANYPDVVARMNFDAFIAEYNSLRTEQLELIKIQNQLYNYLLIIIGTIVTILIAITSKPEFIPFAAPVAFWIALLLPLVIAQISFLFFDHEIAVHAIGSHLYHEIRKRVNELTEVNTLEKEYKHLNSIWDVNYLNVSTRSLHRKLHQTRWLVFLVPIGVSVIILPPLTILNWGWWWKYFTDPPEIQVYILCFVICPLIWLIDLFFFYLLLETDYWGRTKLKDQKIELMANGEFQRNLEGDKFVKWQPFWRRIYFKISPEDNRLLERVRIDPSPDANSNFVQDE